MKNIHVLPTDKPSRLYLDRGKLWIDNLVYGSNNQNIYITSDEEIKEGDWVYLQGLNKIIHCVNVIDGLLEAQNAKKIILTTDQDLIKDGVQSIPDDFLEWFVKNPSCEVVKIESTYKDFNPITYTHKIIIPKEESKQTVQEYEQQGLEKYSYESEPKQETIYEYTENYKPSFVDLTDILPKQETLEEAAERLYPKDLMWGTDLNEDSRNAMLIGAKWRQERMYSEEEVKEILKLRLNWFGISSNTFEDNKWFEKFKKK